MEMIRCNSKNLCRLYRCMLFAFFMVSCGSKTEQQQTMTMTMEKTDILRRAYCDSQFGQIHYRYFYPSDSAQKKTPTLLLHLSPNSSQVFSDFLPLLGKDRMTIAPDYPGYGMSDAIVGEQKIADYAKAMLAVIDTLQLNEPVDLIGYHTGAAVALEMAAQEPEKIKKIALVAVPVLTKEERKAGAALPKIPFDTLGNFAKKEWQSSWKWKGPEQSVTSVFATFSAKMRPGARELGATAILNHDTAPNLEKLPHPLLIVNVGDDLWNATLRAKKLKPHATYKELPEFGHGLFHAAPQKMDTIIRTFLDEE